MLVHCFRKTLKPTRSETPHFSERPLVSKWAARRSMSVTAAARKTGSDWVFCESFRLSGLVRKMTQLVRRMVGLFFA